jgi:hypothetical protein
LRQLRLAPFHRAALIPRSLNSASVSSISLESPV